MSHGINAIRAVIVALLCLSTPALTASATTPPAEAVTETIQGEHLLIESTTTPELFTALAPGDVVEWDVSISTQEPAEGIEAELLVDGGIPLEVIVFSCEQPWSQSPNSGSQSADCENPAGVETAQQLLYEGSAPESFEVPQGHHLRLVFQAGSFDTEARGKIYLRATAEGEHLDVAPPREAPLEEQSEGAVEEQSEAVAPSEEHRQETVSASQLSETPRNDTQESPQGEQRGCLPVTGANIALILVGALLLLGVGSYLRRRGGSSSFATNGG